LKNLVISTLSSISDDTSFHTQNHWGQNCWLTRSWQLRKNIM